MTNNEFIKQEAEKYSRRYNAMCIFPSVNFISHIGVGTIFLEDTETVSDLLQQIKPFEDSGWQLSSYYIGASGNIALRYEKEGFRYRAVFFCDDINGVIDWFGFTCKVKENHRTETVKSLVCEA